MFTGGRQVSSNTAVDSLIAPQAPSNNESKLALAHSIHADGSEFFVVPAISHIIIIIMDLTFHTRRVLRVESASRWSI